MQRLHSLVHDTTGPVVVLTSGRTSTESLGWIMRLVEARSTVAAMKVPMGDEAPLAGIPNLALRRERAGNLMGAEMVGMRDAWDTAMSRVASGGVVIVLDADLPILRQPRCRGSARRAFRHAIARSPAHRGAHPSVTMLPENWACMCTVTAGATIPARAHRNPVWPVPAWWPRPAPWHSRRGAGRPATASEAFCVAPGVRRRDASRPRVSSGLVVGGPCGGVMTPEMRGFSSPAPRSSWS